MKLNVPHLSDRTGESEPSPMRAAVRFPLHLPVQLRTDAGLVDAITEDISSTGALFLTQVAPENGSMLEWNLQLPADILGTPGNVQIDCVGRVVWTEVQPNGVRVGAVIDHYEMKDKSA